MPTLPTEPATPAAPVVVDIGEPTCDSSSSSSTLSGHCYHHNAATGDENKHGGGAGDDLVSEPGGHDDDADDDRPLVHMYTVTTHSPAQPPAGATATASQSLGTSRTGAGAPVTPLLHTVIADCRTALLQLTHKHGDMAARLTRKFGLADRSRYMSSESLLQSPPSQSGALGGSSAAIIPMATVSPTAAVPTRSSARQSPADAGHRHRDPSSAAAEKPGTAGDAALLMTTSVTSIGRPSPHARELAAEITAHLVSAARAAGTDSDAAAILQPVVIAALQAATLSLRDPQRNVPRWPAPGNNMADANESIRQHTASASTATAAESIRSLLREPAAFTATAAVEEHEDAFEEGYTVNQYLLIDKIGSGKQGEVFVAEDTITGETRAVKAVRRPAAARARGGGALAAARSRQAQQLEREVAVMRQCRHRNIVALHEVIDDPDHDTMYLVMQYVEAGAIAKIAPDGCCSEVLDPMLLTQFARQLCAGLQYLHGHGVIHRDIKPDNILRGRDGTVYLSDFGVSELFELASSTPSVSVANTSFTSNVPVHGTRGTVAFMAPELFSATETQGTPGEAVDVWALGVTFYALLFGKLPFDLSSMGSLTRDIMSFDPVKRIPVTGFGPGSGGGSGFSPPEANAEVDADGGPSPMSQFAPQTPRSDDFSPETPPRQIPNTRRGSHVATAAATPLLAASLGGLPTFAGPVTPLAQSHSQRRGSGSSCDAPKSQTFDSVGAAAMLWQEWQLLLREMLCPDPIRRIQTGLLRRRVRAMAEGATNVMNSSVFATSAFIGGIHGAGAALLSPSAGPAEPKPISNRWQLNEK